jgi:catechol 2,3-dioxygenase-like lactoylglutathione lyase family enzyme
MASAPSHRDRRSGEAPPLVGVYETVLYGPDVDALSHFYADLVGLRLIEVAPNRLLAACRLPDGTVLLLFDPVIAAATGRQVPAHGASGPGHIAFRVEPGTLGAWRSHLEASGLEIERVVRWSASLTSIYVRDPAGNSVEFTDGELWE